MRLYQHARFDIVSKEFVCSCRKPCSHVNEQHSQKPDICVPIEGQTEIRVCSILFWFVIQGRITGVPQVVVLTQPSSSECPGLYRSEGS
jgi:hypothetical protein